MLARVLPVPLAFWAAAGLVLLLGLGMTLAFGPRTLPRLPGGLRALPWGMLAGLAGVTLFSYLVGRGEAIFDDYMQLPTVSTMAAGFIPPRFALDPSVPYDYHYFMLLFSAQIQRIGGLAPWTALDLGHSLPVGLAVMLAFRWTRRSARSLSAGVLGAGFVLFASGARWLMLLLPLRLLQSIAAHVNLLGSGAGSGATLFQALANPWAIEGAASPGLPFAFTNGLQQPGILGQFSANSLVEVALMLALLLTCTRWRSNWPAGLATALFFSAGFLLTEAGVVLEIGGWGLVVLITAGRLRSLKLPPTLWKWLASAGGGYLLGALQGGALPDALGQALGMAQGSSYHNVSFQLVFPPTLVSSHLGVLSLFNPAQLLAALFELGPLLLALPFLAAWGWKALRAGRWFEAVLAGEAFLSLLMLFVQYSGSEGVRNTSRLYRFLPILALFAVPAVWPWAERRGPAYRWTAGVLAGTVMLGGLAIFCLELPALQRPVVSYDLNGLDASMNAALWNRLERDALVFDPLSYRAPALLGRFTDSSTTWYASKPAWKALNQEPYPVRLRAAGYSYAYLDNLYFQGLPVVVQQAWGAGCVKQMGEAVKGQNWRRLYEIKTCTP